MTKKHNALLDNVLGEMEQNSSLEQPSKPKRKSTIRSKERFVSRTSALAERLSGDAVEKTLHWVDPERCRMWKSHNRRYELLDEIRCADLIDAFKAQGQQEFPAIVRKVTDSDEWDYEVICGARRHWTVSWLRRNNYRQFRFLIEVRELSDEEAFRLSDVENRDRDDISDYERAMDYAKALQAYYGGRQKEMAKRMEVSEAWLSRYLALAKLPKSVIDAYASITHIKERHARELNPILAHPSRKIDVVKEAQEITKLQQVELIDGATVFKRLKSAASKIKKVREKGKSYYDHRGKLILKSTAKKGKRLVLEVTDTSDIEEVLAACRLAMEDQRN